MLVVGENDAMSETFSFRWGIELLDRGFTQIPNLFFDWYHVVCSYKEFMLILHLSRYQFEKPGSVARPSLATIAQQMGINIKSVRRSLVELEQRGLLTVTRIPGQSSEYCFSGFSHAVVSHAMGQGTPKNGSTPKNGRGSTPKNGRGVLPKMGDEEEDKEEHTKQVNDDGQAQLTLKPSFNPVVMTLLQSAGIDAGMARQLSEHITSEEAQHWIDAAQARPGLRNRAAWIVAGIRRGDDPPVTKKQLTFEEGEAERRRRLLERAKMYGLGV
jgi:hypothetical protein